MESLDPDVYDTWEGGRQTVWGCHIRGIINFNVNFEGHLCSYKGALQDFPTVMPFVIKNSRGCGPEVSA